jgi:hypothetical protein
MLTKTVNYQITEHALQNQSTGNRIGTSMTFIRLKTMELEQANNIQKMKLLLMIS